jgi:hypothetical protein
VKLTLNSGLSQHMLGPLCQREGAAQHKYSSAATMASSGMCARNMPNACQFPGERLCASTDTVSHSTSKMFLASSFLVGLVGVNPNISFHSLLQPLQRFTLPLSSCQSLQVELLDWIVIARRSFLLGPRNKGTACKCFR